MQIHQKGVAVQLATRFGPAIEKISEMNNLEYIYGLGLGTYFEIPWFKYRGLDTKLNTIDSTYLSLFVKYGILSLLIIYMFFRLLLFNISNSNMRAFIHNFLFNYFLYIIKLISIWNRLSFLIFKFAHIFCKR